jgi:hypothetical protein
MAKYNYNHKNLIGTICIIVGLIIAIFSIGDLFFRLITALMGLSIINYGLRIKGLPPLQMLIPMIISRNRWF